VLDALLRIEAGSVDPDDFSCVGERWDLREQLQAQWHLLGLPALDPLQPAATLSGGQAMQVALAGAFLSGAEGLILDEPSNHLDADHRARLIDALKRWQGGLIVISHDRTLLRHMTRIVELTPSGLRQYGGNYDHYAEQRRDERRSADAQLALGASASAASSRMSCAISASAWSIGRHAPHARHAPPTRRRSCWVA